MCFSHSPKRNDKKVADHKILQPQHKNHELEPKPRQKPRQELSRFSQLHVGGSAGSVAVAVADALNNLVSGY